MEKLKETEKFLGGKNDEDKKKLLKFEICLDDRKIIGTKNCWGVFQ